MLRTPFFLQGRNPYQKEVKAGSQVHCRFFYRKNQWLFPGERVASDFTFNLETKIAKMNLVLFFSLFDYLVKGE
jgi:hypothetical protein